MQALTQNILGGPEVLHLVEQPRPTPGPSEVLVRVRATGLSPTDWVHRRIPGFLGDGPKVLGWDVSGIVEEVGFGVSIHKPGDEVFGMLPYPHGHGAAAEFVVSPARNLVQKPTNINHEAASAVPLAALTAWQALVNVADVQPGQRVLVHAAAGGVGHFAVQIAKANGAYVIGTASSVNHELVKSLGADDVIDYTRDDFSTIAQDIDAVLDTIGGDYVPRSLRTLRAGGVIVSIALNVTVDHSIEAKAIGARHEMMLVEGDQAGMQAIAKLLRDGSIRPVIAATFPLRDAHRAHELGESGHVAGKIVLTV
ncbi:MAG: NADPH:quinone reductase [Candidatus Lumbricidophila eiseniae]|uniref:NADPH:quinone reductase n=1 Tax=Candidatus Lumbricidiphila eiseniae TaxID=1969409 RepID=A0A2A6FU63_9MICO|nr:MAG: NADPH:quinone reductase [Candidatus Lumbricidophila eiseniae]